MQSVGAQLCCSQSLRLHYAACPLLDQANGKSVVQREEGRIKNWNRDRGYGFIRADNGRDIFTHISQTGFLIPKDGSRVSFDIGENPRTGKPEAKNVSILDDGDSHE